MSAIQSNIGLITGIPIQDTVSQLIQISARPRDLLASRTNGLRSEQAAVDRLSSLVLSLQFSANKFKNSSTFAGRSATSNSDAVSVAVASGATPAPGSYQLTPLQSASSHQLVSRSFEDITDAVGDGTLRFGFGGHVDRGVDLNQLNGGDGAEPGSIKITDKNGDTATIDLRTAQSVDEVLTAINSNSDVSVSAATDGDSFTITDISGGSGTLSVADIGLGTTAAALGLAGLSTGGTSLTGADVFTLHSGSKLSSLNDETGVRLIEGEDDLQFTLRDGATTFGVDLSGSTTLGDVVDAINNDEDNGGNLTAEISANGRGLTLTDNTGATASNLIVANGALGSAADDLGIAADVASDTISGARLAAGLRDTLVTSLNGGQGIDLGTIDVTDRSGASASIDLSGLETLGQIVSAINAEAGVDVTASINSSRNGIAITDNTAGGGNLTIADSGATTTATDLGIAVDDAVSSINGSSLNRQKVSEATLLSSFNGGKGVALGDFTITDAAGSVGVVDLNTLGSEAETIGDVIDRINALDINVLASINDTGDGLLLTDTSSSGEGVLTVAELANGTSAADLNLLGASTTTNGSDQQIIDGTTSYAIDLTDLDAQQDAGDLSLASLGVNLGVFEVFTANSTDEQPESFFVNLNQPGDVAVTVSDVIDKINAAAAAEGVSVTASLNEAGTGIAIADATGGSGALRVEDLGDSGSAAADLNLLGSATTSGDVQTINGAGLFSAIDAEQGALTTLVERINETNAGVTASIVSDLSGSRLAITADNPGAANELLIDSTSTGFDFQETSRPADAVALFGTSTLAGGGFTVRSTDNSFDNIVDGLDISVSEATGETATIDVAIDDSPLVDAAQDFVDAYNSLRTNLDQVTDFDPETLSTGILFGRSEVLRVDTELSRILSSRALSNTNFGSLESIGISLDDSGKLSLDSSKLQDAFAENPADIESLFLDEDDGVVARLTTAIDQLAGDENSLLSNRSDTLQRTIDTNDDRIASLGESLEKERDRLLLQFFRLEETIALLQSNNDAISSIQPISINFTSSNNS